MKQSFIYEALGQKLQKLIKKSNLPSLDTSLFSSEHCEEIRSQWYGISNEDNKLKNLLVKVILNGKIEEIQDKEDYYTFLIQVKYKSEYYLLELKLINYTWSFYSLQYIGNAPRSSLFWILGSGLVIGVIALSYLFSSYYQDQKSSNLGEYTENKLNNEAFVHIETEENKKSFEKHPDYFFIQESKSSKFESSDSESNENRPKEIEITIQPGMVSRDVINLLAEARIIENKKDMEEIMTRLKVDHKIRTGTYKIFIGSSYLEVIDLITHQ